MSNTKLNNPISLNDLTEREKQIHMIAYEKDLRDAKAVMGGAPLKVNEEAKDSYSIINEQIKEIREKATANVMQEEINNHTLNGWLCPNCGPLQHVEVTYHEYCAKCAAFVGITNEPREISGNEEIVALKKFKEYVHKRLDDAGIPTHPDGEHSKHGCRIGDRLDIALRRQSASDISRKVIERAIYMLRIAGAHCRQYGHEDITHYDGADCDGGCISDDCKAAAEELQRLLKLEEK